MFNFIKRIFCKNDAKSDVDLLRIVQDNPTFQKEVNDLKVKLVAEDLVTQMALQRDMTVVFVCGQYYGLSEIVTTALNSITTNEKCIVVMLGANLRLNDIVTKWVISDYYIKCIDLSDIRIQMGLESFIKTLYRGYSPDYIVSFSENDVIDTICKIASPRRISKFYGNNQEFKSLMKTLEPDVRT